MDYEFPFDVPNDLGVLSAEALAELLGHIRQHAADLASAQATAETVHGLRACRDLARTAGDRLSAVRAEAAEAEQITAEAQQLAAEVSTSTDVPAPAAQAPAVAQTVTDTDAETSAGGGGETAAVTAPAVTAAAAGTVRAPSVREVAAQRAGRPVDLGDGGGAPMMTMVAGPNVPRFSAGQQLTFPEAVQAIEAGIALHPRMSAGRASGVPGKRPITVYDPDAPARRLELRSFTRYPAVELRREFPREMRILNGRAAMPDWTIDQTLEYVASERRLPGGSLVRSAQQMTERGRSLTAATGWCAPSETIYELMELETLDGILSLPELQTTRGGWQIPANGGPAFSTIWNGIGNSGVTHLTELQIEADATKYAWDIPCPDFTDVRLGADYVCLTGGLLQRRGYPENVARFSRGATTALAHKINQGVIAAIVAIAGAATVIPADPSGDDAISGLLAAIDLAIIDAKYRARMAFSRTMEIVLPMWVLGQLRASATRRRGVDMVGMTDAQIMSWFAQRYAVPQFVVDWQDAFTSLVGGPGAVAPLTALPTTCNFLVYPAGTLVKAVQDVVSLDTIYDSTKLSTNEYTALFAEDGWAVLQLGREIWQYTAVVDPSGVVGCCPAEVS